MVVFIYTYILTTWVVAIHSRAPRTHAQKRRQRKGGRARRFPTHHPPFSTFPSGVERSRTDRTADGLEGRPGRPASGLGATSGPPKR
eukprot:5983417-Pleurochrysis_carterae.AAC.2